MFKVLRKYLLGVSSKNVRVEVRNFSVSENAVKTHLENIGLYFLKGYHTYLENLSPELFPDKVNTIDKKYLGFAYEGAAMSMAILDFIMPWRKNQLPLFINGEGQNHIYMLHVGAGWAIARLPVDPEKFIRKYHPLYRWLAIDGYGFHQAYFKTKSYVYQQKNPENLSSEARPVFYQGVGRCLWFIEGAQPEKIDQTINKFPEVLRKDLWAGVGLAASYAGGIDKDGLSLLKELSGIYLPQLGQGAAFAAKARTRAANVTPNTQLACKIFTNKSTLELATITDETQSRLGQRGIGTVDTYQLWRKLISSYIFDSQLSQIKNNNVKKQLDKINNYPNERNVNPADPVWLNNPASTKPG